MLLFHFPALPFASPHGHDLAVHPRLLVANKILRDVVVNVVVDDRVADFGFGERTFGENM